MHKACRRIDRPRCAHHQHQRRLPNLFLNALHLQRNLAEEDNVRAQPAAAHAAAHLAQRAIDCMILNRRVAAVPLAMRLAQFAVHVEQPPRAGPLVQIVHILCAEKEARAELCLQLGERNVRGIRLGKSARRAPLRVELPDAPGIALPGFGRADILDAIAGPKAVGGAKGRQAALRADARAGEDEDLVVGFDGNLVHGFLSGGLTGRVRSFPPMRQKEVAWMGHGAFVEHRRIMTRAAS